MKQNFTLLTKNTGLALGCLILSLSLNAQNIVLDGDMTTTAEDTWTMGWRNGTADLSSVEFGAEGDDVLPLGSESLTVARIMFGSSWNETQLWQEVTLSANVTYVLEAKLKIEVAADNSWVQGFIMPYQEPELADQNAFSDAQLINSVQLLQVNDFVTDSEEIMMVDGDFPKNVANSDKFTADSSYTPEYDGDFYVLFKFGGNVDPTTASLTDVVLMEEGSGLGLNMLNQSVVKVYPTSATEFIKVSGLRNEARAEIYSVTGSLISSSRIRNSQSIDVSSLSSGIYVLQLSEGAERSTHKFFKQ